MSIQILDISEKFKKIIIEKISRFFLGKDYYSSTFERKKSWILTKILLISGYFYHYYKTKQEIIRISICNFRDSFINIQIFYEIVIHTKKLLFLIFFTGLILSSIYLFFNQNITLTLSTDSIESLLLAYFAGITTLLGIIFAFYAVGFQIATSKFSSEVTEYINREKVGRFFFNLLVIAGIFSLFTLIGQYLVDFPLVIPFIIATFLVIFSLLGILIFKDDYVTKLKPQSIFTQIYNENLRAIRQVNEYNNPDIKNFIVTRNPNITSFNLHLSTRNSCSIVMTHQRNVERRLKIHGTLFRDLIREGSLEDASYGINILGYFLNSYIEIKHFIDTDRLWWFPTFQDVVTADNMSMFPLKANYESQGIGRMGITKSNITWLEDRIVDQFKNIQNDSKLIKNQKIVSALIHSYETILAGRFERTKLGLQKTVHGVYELQDFVLAKQVLTLFFELGEKITDENLNIEYLNGLGDIKTVIADGFSLRAFPGRLEDWEPKFVAWVKSLFRAEKTTDRVLIIEHKLPKYFHELLIDSLERLNVEEFTERKLITPESWLVKELVEQAKTKEKEVREDFLFSLLDGMFKHWEESADTLLKNNYGLIVFGLFNQLISSGEWEFLEKVIIKYKTKLFALFAKMDSEKFIELELREPIDFGAFKALVARKKVVFDFYNSMFFVTQIHLGMKLNRSDTTQVIKLARRPMMLGGLAYLVSELDDDFYYVKIVTSSAKTLFPNADLVTIFELTKGMKVELGTSTLFQIIYEESNRYRSYYRNIINSIFELPQDWIIKGGPSYGMSSTQTVKHKSEFIRDLASDRFSDMEECFDGYVEWLKAEQVEEHKQIKKSHGVTNSDK